MNEKIRNIRFFFLGFSLLAIFVLAPPMKDSLEKSEATVSSARQLLTRFDVEYALANGQVIKETIKSSQIVPGDINKAGLLQIQGTNEKLNVWHKNGKVWQIQKQNGEFLLKFEDIQKRRYIFLFALIGALVFGAVFLPKLVKKP
jgi:hypothetical protein